MAARIGRSRPVSAYIVRPRALDPGPRGTFDMTLNGVTQDWSGTPTPPSGDITIQLAGVTHAETGIVDGAGTVTIQLSQVTQDFAGAIINGSFAMQLGSVTQAHTGDVNPIGGFNMQLSQVTSFQFVGETTPFGEHVIHIEAEERSFLVIDDDPGLKRIKRSQVTDL